MAGYPVRCRVGAFFVMMFGFPFAAYHMVEKPGIDLGKRIVVGRSQPAPRRGHIYVTRGGHWGKNLARNFFNLGHLYAICESDPGRRQSFSELYPAAKVYSGLEEALADPDVDAVVLATPAE